jgi:lysine 2,3-aminomutase
MQSDAALPTAFPPVPNTKPGEAQPFVYPPKRAFVEPDWTRIPGYRGVSKADWESALWQRRHTVKNLKELKAALGELLPDSLAASIERDQKERATMSILITPHMINTMQMEDLWADPLRRYMLPAFDDRHLTWPNHPRASRDSLHEAEMWKVEGLTHRYPTKVLAELLSTCPQYCGHCTRMDLVGNDVPQVDKLKFHVAQPERWAQMLEYLRRTPTVRDVVVSGGDVANVPIGQLENFVSQLLDIPNIRDIRLASKGLMGIPQHWLQDNVLKALERLAKKAFERDVDIAVHTHVNNANQVTPLLGRAARKLLELGFRDVRNQGVLLRGVNATSRDLLELSFMLLDHARILPYYFYMCDMIPNSEHWRVSVGTAQRLQHDIMGYMPGFATPRIVCDVPYVGKRWVHQVAEYDREKGISYWTKNYRTGIEWDDPEALNRKYEYYDPVFDLPESGQQWWREQVQQGSAPSHSVHA